MNPNEDFVIDDAYLLSWEDDPRTFSIEGSEPPPLLPSPSSRPLTQSPWDPRLLMDLALMVDTEEEIVIRYGLTPERLNKLLDNPVFRRELVLLRRDVASNGATFRAKARVQAESYLPEIDSIVMDADIPASIRLDAIKQTVRWADLEPKKTESIEDQKQPQINVQINF